MNSVGARLLVAWLLCVVAGTLAPFRLATGAGLEHGLKVLEFGPHGDPIHFALNILLFVPFGVLLHNERRRRSVGLLPIVVLAGTIGLSLSMAVEYIQAFLPGRDSSIIDVLANTIGSLMGVAADRMWGVPAEAHLARMRAATSRAMLAGLIGSVLVVSLLISGALQTGTRLSNWSAEYPLLVGNELTGDRPWRGRLFAFDITDAATPAASMRRFAAGESVALLGAQLAKFVFDGGQPYKDASGNLPSLEWTEGPKAPGQASVSLPGRSWLRSEGPTAGLAQRLRKTNAFTIRLECATDDTNQDGPARIISNSVSPLLRNFTVGQQGSDLVFRLRTPANGVNGSRFEIHVPGVFADRDPREILATYDGATLLVAMAHGDVVSSTKLTPGSNVALAFPSLNVRPDELRLYDVAYVAALTLVPGALIGFLGHSSRERRVFSIAWVLGFAVLLEVTIVGVSGGSFDWPDVARAAGTGALVLTVFYVIFSTAPDVPWRRPARDGADIARRVALDNQSSRGISRATS